MPEIKSLEATRVILYLLIRRLKSEPYPQNLGGNPTGGESDISGKFNDVPCRGMRGLSGRACRGNPGGLAEVVFILNRGDTLRHGARDAVHGMT